jgi:hypothetical protein
MSNVRPLVSLREGIRLQASRLASSPPEQPLLRQCRWLSRLLNGRLGPSFGKVAGSVVLQALGSAPASSAPHLGATGNVAKCWRPPGQLGSSRKEQIHSFGHHSGPLAANSVQAGAEPQFNQRPNPSIERTRKGRPRYARCIFSASRGLPSRASHVKR